MPLHVVTVELVGPKPAVQRHDIALADCCAVDDRAVGIPHGSHVPVENGQASRLWLALTAFDVPAALVMVTATGPALASSGARTLTWVALTY
jgi:hypothetical protein